jgi:hypothetical protein
MNRKRDVLEGIPALFHTVVYEDVFSAGLKEMTAACHLVVRAYKSNTHTDPSVFCQASGGLAALRFIELTVAFQARLENAGCA